MSRFTLRELFIFPTDETETVSMTKEEMYDLIDEAVNATCENSDESDYPIAAFSISREKPDLYEFSTSHNGLQFDSIFIELEDDY